jgi:hypothetical protein
MTRWIGRGALVLSLFALGSLAVSQDPSPRPRSAEREREEDVNLPSGKSQRDEILKAEREQNIKDANQLAELAGQLKEEIEKNDRFVFSISTLKKTDEIEKLVKRIRSRMRH